MLRAIQELKTVTKTSESMHLRLPVALYQAVCQIATAEGRTIANTIRRLLTEAIERRNG
jgi:hypothetical protein